MFYWNSGFILAVVLLCTACSGPSDALGSNEHSVQANDSLLNDPTVLYVFDQGAPSNDVVIGPHARVFFPGCVTFNDRNVTILEGTQLTFAEGACMIFDGTSRLVVRGTQQDSVYFRPSNGGRQWGYSSGNYSAGLEFYTYNSGESSIAYAVIDSATTGVWAKNNKGLEVIHSRISHSSIQGLHFAGKESLAPNGIRHCTFQDNAQNDIFITQPNNLLRLGDSISAQSNVKITVTSGTIDTVGTISNPGSPIKVLGEITISEVNGNSGVTVSSGTAFLMDTSAGWWINWGNLTMEGSETSPIRLSPARTGSYWKGIKANGPVVLHYVELDSALIGLQAINKSSVEIKHSLIRGCKKIGLESKEGSAILVDSGLTFTRFVDNTLHASLPPGDLASFGDSNSFTSPEAIKIAYGSKISQSLLIRDYGVPYHVVSLFEALADSTITITLEPGVHMYFAPGARLFLGKNAQLFAEGSASDSIVFDELEPGQGWGGSSFDAGGVTFSFNAGNIHNMSYVSLRNAWQGIYLDGSAELRISNSSLVNNKRSGVYVGKNATLVEGEGMSYVGNGNSN